MSSQASKSTSTIRYQPDEKPPYPIALGLALQYSILALGGIVLTVAIVIRSADSGGAELEFLAVGGEGNIEDHMAVIGAHAAEAPEEHEFSLRLLRHLATSVQHHKYEDIDIVTVRVDP